MPQNISSLVVYYNRDLFERFKVADADGRAGLERVPERCAAADARRQRTPRARRDPDAAAPNTARAEIYGLGVEPSLIRIAPFVWSSGGELVDDQDHPTRFTFDTPAAKSALDQFFQLRSLYGVVPSDVEVEAEDDETRFVNGRMAMLLESRRLVPALRQAAEFDWDVAALPRHQQPASILHSDAYCMTKASNGEGRGLAIRRVRARPGGSAGDRAYWTHRTLAPLRGGIRCVPRPTAEAAQREGLPRSGLDDPQRAHRVDVAGDRGRGRADPRECHVPRKPVDDVVDQIDKATRPIFARAE